MLRIFGVKLLMERINRKKADRKRRNQGDFGRGGVRMYEQREDSNQEQYEELMRNYLLYKYITRRH